MLQQQVMCCSILIKYRLSVQAGTPAITLLAMSSVTISKLLCVQGGALQDGKPWVISNSETVGGKDFYRLEKKCSGLCRFVLGKTRPNPLRDYTYLDYLRKERNRACGLTLPEVAPGAGTIGHMKDTRYSRRQALKRQKILRINNRKSDCTDTDPVVELEEPEIEFHGCTAEATVLRVKRSENPLDGVAIELTEESLAYIRVAILAHGKGEEKHRLRRNKDTDDCDCSSEGNYVEEDEEGEEENDGDNENKEDDRKNTSNEAEDEREEGRQDDDGGNAPQDVMTPVKRHVSGVELEDSGEQESATKEGAPERKALGVMGMLLKQPTKRPAEGGLANAARTRPRGRRIAATRSLADSPQMFG